MAFGGEASRRGRTLVADAGTSHCLGEKSEVLTCGGRLCTGFEMGYKTDY